jgi:hypothetical protein
VSDVLDWALQVVSDAERARCYGVRYPHNHEVLSALVAEVKTLRDTVKVLRESHYYVLDVCDEYVCAECGQNPCPTLAVLTQIDIAPHYRNPNDERRTGDHPRRPRRPRRLAPARRLP